MIIKYNIFSDGSKVWLRNLEHHREGGPAIEFVNGTKEWLQNDQLHRTNGPAIEYSNGTKKWFFEGKECTEVQYYTLLTRY
jgi:hypothetical protein